jgi:protein gp37
MAKRYGWAKWGPGEIRRFAAASTWKQTLAWNRKAQRDGVRRRVFCSHLSDVFDAEVDDEWRVVLIERIRETPWLDWLLLTKRPKVAAEFFDVVGVPSNVWMGTTVENQAMADLRIPILRTIPARIHFASCEPLLGSVDLSRWAWGPNSFWVIAGGESGPKARPSSIQWYRSLRDQCQAAGVPFFFKQWGEWRPAGIHPAEAPGKFAFGDYEHDPSLFIETDCYPRQFTMFGARAVVERVGKKAAGALLDGREHREFPR